MNEAVDREFREDELFTTVPLRFRQVLAQLPADQPAYVGENERLTYQELASASRRLAAALAARIGRAATRAEQKAVALLLPPGSAALIGIMGVLEAGHFYVPLDFVAGEELLRYILSDCPPHAIVTTTAMQEQLRAILPPDFQTAFQNEKAACDIILLDALSAEESPASFELPEDGSMYASVLYTSGSTGKARGVINTHALNSYAGYLANHDFGFAPGARVASLRSYFHGSSTPSIFGTLLNGATQFGLPQSDFTPAVLYRWIVENEIAHLHVSNGMLRGLTEYAALNHPHEKLTSLRTIITGGEALQPVDVVRLDPFLPTSCKFVCRLVSTEATVYARYVIPAGASWAGDQLPAGYTPPGSEVLILDDDQRPVAAGEPGEIAVRSRFLAAGYWNRAEDTAARFLPDADDDRKRIFLTGDVGRRGPDGLLVHGGRKDFMVKIRGYRVQLEEVEIALTTIPEVQQAAVIAQPLLSGEKRLVAYIVPREMPGPSADDLRRALRDRLPPYMMPSAFKTMASLPTTTGGKVDRKALPPPGCERPATEVPLVAPRTEIEARLAAIWEETLEVSPIGVHDDFFTLGGHSLALLKLAMLLQKNFGRDVSFVVFLKHSTIEKLAQLLSSDEVQEERSGAPGEPRDAATSASSVRPRLRDRVASTLARLGLHRSSASVNSDARSSDERR